MKNKMSLENILEVNIPPLLRNGGGGNFVLIKGPNDTYFIYVGAGSHPETYHDFMVENEIKEDQKNLFKPMGGGRLFYLDMPEVGIKEIEVESSSLKYGPFDEKITKELLEKNFKDIKIIVK